MQQPYLQSCYGTEIGAIANVSVMGEPRNDRELIEALCKWAGKSPSEVARSAGLAVSTLTRPLNQPVKHRLSIPTLTKLRIRYPSFPGFAGGADALLLPVEREYVPVRVLPSFAGMGGGGEGGIEDNPETALVPRDLIEGELRGRNKDFELIRVRGDSMEPIFRHGDELLIDRRDRNPVQPGPFALFDGDAYVVKLVERIPGKKGWYRLFSANDRYSPDEVEETATTIMGRPVWFARRL